MATVANLTQPDLARNGVDISALNPASGNDFNNLIDLSYPVSDGTYLGKGLTLVTKDLTNGVADVPNAATVTKWKRYLWIRVPHAAATSKSPIMYAWNPDIADDTYGAGFRKWAPTSVDIDSFNAQLNSLVASITIANTNANAALTSANTASGLVTTLQGNVATINGQINTLNNVKPKLFTSDPLAFNYALGAQTLGANHGLASSPDFIDGYAIVMIAHATWSQYTKIPIRDIISSASAAGPAWRTFWMYGDSVTSYMRFDINGAVGTYVGGGFGATGKYSDSIDLTKCNIYLTSLFFPRS